MRLHPATRRRDTSRPATTLDPVRSVTLPIPAHSATESQVGAAGTFQRSRPLALGWFHPTALSLLLVVFAAASLFRLAAVPRVHQDEPWIASVGWKLATQQVFGSDLFAGFYGMDRHYLEFMPVYPMIQSVVFSLFGVGLVQARAVSVGLGMIVLILTYWLGARLFGSTAGLLAVLILLGVRLTATSLTQPTGIPLFDTSRIARYDIAVPVFGLASLLCFWYARSRRRLSLFALAGSLAALASLTHLYGAFWILPLVLLSLGASRHPASVAALILGFFGPWLAYAAFALPHLGDLSGQMSVDAARFEVLNPGWYWSNIVQERTRYAPGLGHLAWGDLLRPGLLFWVIALPSALASLVWRSMRWRDPAATALMVCIVTLLVCFASLIHLKTPAYAATIYPLLALAAAWGSLQVWGWAKHTRHARLLVTLIAALFLLALLEGTIRVERAVVRAGEAEDYRQLSSQLQSSIGPGARVLMLHTYWFDLEDRDMRSWFVPLNQINARFWRPPRTIEAALDEVSPDFVVVDPVIRARLAAEPPLAASIERWLIERGYERIRVFDDSIYGRFEVYAIN